MKPQETVVSDHNTCHPLVANKPSLSNIPLVEPFMQTLPPLYPNIIALKVNDIKSNDQELNIKQANSAIMRNLKGSNSNEPSTVVTNIKNIPNNSTQPLSSFVGKNFSNPNFNIPEHDKKQLMLPIRLFIKINNRESSVSAKEVNSQLGDFSSYLYNWKPLENEDKAPNHVEILAFYKEGGNILRSLVVFGQMDQIGCMFNSASAAASCCKGWNARNSIVFLDRDFTKTLESVLDNVVNNPKLANDSDLHQYLLLNKEFRDFAKIRYF